MNFSDFALNPQILKAIQELGFEVPTPIQEKTIPVIIDKQHDLIGLAQTGTGKTAAFGLPILSQLDPDGQNVQCIILSPTRELGMQIAKDLERFSKYMKGTRVTPVYGGASIDQQIRALKKGSHIVVGTPGRTVDLIKRKALKIHDVNFLVLDEADEMLNMGFKDDLDYILSCTPDNKQTLLFSATMPKEIRKIASNYLNAPEEIAVGTRNKGAENVSHHYYVTSAKNRYHSLRRVIDMNPEFYGIIFCRTRSDTKDVANRLMKEGYNADALHGDLSQVQRDNVMNRFRVKNIQLLVATDVAARGLDVNNLTHVINYNLPEELEAYIHRSGRTGRAGKGGVSVALINSRELGKIKQIEKIVGKPFQREMVPNGHEICEKQLVNLVNNVENVAVDEEKIAPYMDNIFQQLEGVSREDLIKKFVSVEFNRFLENYQDTKDLNEEPVDMKQVRKSTKGYSRFYINIGSKNGLTIEQMIGLVNDTCKRRDIAIGKIDIMKKFSFFEVDSQFEKLVRESFKKASFGNISLDVQHSKPRDSRNQQARKPKQGYQGHQHKNKKRGKKKRSRSMAVNY